MFSVTAWDRHRARGSDRKAWNSRSRRSCSSI
ncbi:hypothetical protein V6Z11_D12G000800 [Gossypium hirsutum]